MKTQLLGSILLLGVVAVSASAQAFDHHCMGIPGKENTYYGPTKCSGVDLPELTVDGYLKLTDHSVIHGTLTTNGVLEVSDSVIEGVIKCNGLFNIVHGMVQGAVDESGNINASGATFQKTITLQPELSQSTVTLAAGSTVGGDIVFRGAIPGLVYLSSGSSVMGKVINGRIVPKG